MRLQDTPSLPIMIYLFSLWPKVQISVEAEPETDTSEEEFEEDIRAIALTNEYLARLSCCNRDPTIKYEDMNVLRED
jgi:hypothetical protein